MAQHFDLVIRGSGSTAFAATLRVAELGKAAVMTEVRMVARNLCEPWLPSLEEPYRGGEDLLRSDASALCRLGNCGNEPQF